MLSISLWPSLVAVALALVPAYIVTRVQSADTERGRFSSIDGLRGYLAFGVFLHHSLVWNQYLHTGEWKIPPSNFYTHLGQSGVTFFFMITAFLFARKVGRTAHERDISWWLRLYRGRLVRLAPLYISMLLLMVIIVGVQSDWEIKEPLGKFMFGLLRWGSFTILGHPDLNLVPKTSMMNAGVAWSLVYEWGFYASLPIVACILRAPRFWPHALLISFGLIFAIFKQYLILAFISGTYCAILFEIRLISNFAKTNAASVFASLTLVCIIYFYPTGNELFPVLAISMIFLLFTAGNSLFGILSSKISRTFGETAYSIYLIHGLVLYVTFHFFVPAGLITTLSTIGYWSIIWSLTPIVVILSFLAHRLIEIPPMKLESRFAQRRFNKFTPLKSDDIQTPARF